MRQSTSFPGLRVLCAAAFAFGLAACSSVNPYEKNREMLASATSELASANFEQAARQAERLYAGRSGEADKFLLQRYFALFVLAEAHTQAAIRKPFLGGTPGASAGSQAGIGSARNSDVAHLVAATYYAGLARDLAPGAQAEAPVADGTNLLPPELGAVSVENAQEKLDLIRLVALARLGFAGTYQSELEKWDALQESGGLDKMIARVGLEKELVPWAYYAMFRYMKDRNDYDSAYAFGAKARMAADEKDRPMPADRLGEIIAWVKDKSNPFEFVCQKCRKPFLPDMLRCGDDSTPITTFFPIARAK